MVRLSALLMVFALALTACGRGKPQPSGQATDLPTVTQSLSESPSPSPSPVASSSPTPTPSKSAEPKSSPTPDPPTATIKGNVTGPDDVNGNAGDAPVAGICIYAWPNAKGPIAAHAKTNAEGRFTFKGLDPDRDYKLQAKDCAPPNEWLAEFYGESRTYADAKTVKVDPDETVTGIRIGVINGAQLAGKITDENGDPVAGICIKVWDGDTLANDDFVTKTGSTGKYKIQALEGNLYKIQFSACDNDQVKGEWYRDKSSRATATTVLLEEDGSVQPISAELAPA